MLEAYQLVIFLFNINQVKCEIVCNRPDDDFRQAALVTRGCRRYETLITSNSLDADSILQIVGSFHSKCRTTDPLKPVLVSTSRATINGWKWSKVAEDKQSVGEYAGSNPWAYRNPQFFSYESRGIGEQQLYCLIKCMW